MLDLLCCREMFGRVCRARVVVGLAFEPLSGGEFCASVAPCCRVLGVLFGVEGGFVILTREAVSLDL